MKVLVFDTETTGLPKDRFASFKDTHLGPHIVQLSFMVHNTDTNSLTHRNIIVAIDDEVELSERSVEIHGITRERSKTEGIPVKDALEEFRIACGQADVIVAHNMSFDKAMVIVESQRNGTRHELYRTKAYVCTMKATKDLCGIQAISQKDGQSYTKYPTLTELHTKLFAEAPENTHDAFVDVLICLRCYMKFAHSVDMCAESADFKKLYAVTGL